MAGAPPGSEGQAKHVQHAKNGSHANEHAENQTDSDEQFHDPDQISKENDVRQHDVTENRPVKADGRLLDEALEIVCESGVREFAPKDFVLAKKDEEYSGANASDEQSFRERSAEWFRQRPSPSGKLASSEPHRVGA